MPIYYRDLKEIVPAKEWEKFVNAADTLEQKAVLALAWLTGARISEILSLEKSDFYVNEERKLITVTLRARKGGKIGYPTFSFSDCFATFILDRLAQLQEREKIAKRGKRWWQKFLIKLNKKIYPNEKSKWITWHFLRHNRITLLARLGATGEELKSWTGHRSSAYEEYIAVRRVERFAGKL